MEASHKNHLPYINGKDAEEDADSFQVRPATWVTVAVLRFPDSCLGKHDTFDHAWLDTSLIDNGCAVFIDFAVMYIVVQ